MSSHAELPPPGDPFWERRGQKIDVWLKANGIDHKWDDMIKGPTLLAPTIEYTVVIDGRQEDHEVPCIVRPNIRDWWQGAEEAIARHKRERVGQVAS